MRTSNWFWVIYNILPSPSVLLPPWCQSAKAKAAAVACGVRPCRQWVVAVRGGGRWLWCTAEAAVVAAEATGGGSSWGWRPRTHNKNVRAWGRWPLRSSCSYVLLCLVTGSVSPEFQAGICSEDSPIMGLLHSYRPSPNLL